MDSEQTLDSAEDDYWHSYGMDCDPFASAAIEGLYFPGGDRGELLQTAAHIAQYSRQPVVFYGAEGVGKTTLLNAVASSVDDATMAMKLQAGFMTTREQIFAEIANSLSMTDVNYIPSAFREQVGVALSKMDEGKTSLLLLVDDSHELIDKSLHALRELAEDESSVIRVLFFASTDGNGFLRPELDRSDVQQLAIQPLDREGIKDYLLYRLSTAGFDQVEFPFTDADIDSILKQSLGIPARIGRVAEQKLRHKSRLASLGADQTPIQLKPGIPWGHALLAAGLLAGILLIVFWGASDSRRSDNELQAPVAVDDELGELDEELDDLEARAAELIAQNEAANAVDSESATALLDDVEPNSTDNEAGSEDVQLANATASDAITDVGDEAAALTEELAASSQVDPVAEPIVDAQESAEQLSAEQNLADKGSVDEIPVAETLPLEEPVEETIQDVIVVEPPIAAAEPDVEPTIQPTISPEVTGDSGNVFGMTDFERELLGSNGTHTLQLLSGGSEAAMVEFARKYANQGVRFYLRRKNGQASYVAVVGEYNSSQEARAAVSGLPAALSRSKPWPRTLSSVQTEIRDARTP